MGLDAVIVSATQTMLQSLAVLVAVQLSEDENVPEVDESSEEEGVEGLGSSVGLGPFFGLSESIFGVQSPTCTKRILMQGRWNLGSSGNREHQSRCLGFQEGSK